MTIRHLKIFLAVCDGGCNTTRAAEALTMAQPAVSLALKELEQYYGVVLFDRVGRHLQITAAGKRLWEYASHITSLFDDMEKGMRDWDTFGLLRVGASITIGSQFLPNYVKAFYARHPGTEIRAVIEPSDRLEAQILSSDLDLALMEGMSHSPSLESEEYMEDHLGGDLSGPGPVCPGSDPDPRGIPKPEISAAGAGQRHPGDLPAGHGGGGTLGGALWEAMSTTALVNAVINGLGITVLPHRMVLGPLSKGRVVSVGVEGLEFRRKYYIVRHRAKYLTASARAFLDLCRSYEMDYPMPRYSGLF